MLNKIKVWAKSLKTNIMALYYVLKRKDLNILIKGFIALVVGYSLSPIDLIPDFIPILGYLDDLFIVPLGIWLSIKMVPKPILRECLEIAKNRSNEERPKARVAVFIIIAIWIILFIGLLLYFYDDLVELFA